MSEPTHAVMTDEKFFRDFKPVKNHLDDNASWGGCMFETYGEELDYVLQVANSEPRREC